jgi:hypothetical protein
MSPDKKARCSTNECGNRPDHAPNQTATKYQNNAFHTASLCHSQQPADTLSMVDFTTAGLTSGLSQFRILYITTVSGVKHVLRSAW